MSNVSLAARAGLCVSMVLSMLLGCSTKRKLTTVDFLQLDLAALLKKADPKKRAALAQRIATKAMLRKLELLGDQVVAIGLQSDRWTTELKPAAVVFTNGDAGAFTPELELGCDARPKYLPVTVTIDDGQKKRRVVFERAGYQRVRLSAVPPQGRKMFIITTDKVWVPGGRDSRFLGVKVGISHQALLESLRHQKDLTKWAEMGKLLATEKVQGKVPLLGNLVVGLGLDGKRYTAGGGLGGVVVTNKATGPLTPRLLLSCAADPSRLPLTAMIHDGRRSQLVQFQGPGPIPVSLSPVPPRSHRLYIISTDRSWSLPDPASPALGVKVDIAFHAQLRALLLASDDVYRAKLVEFIIKAPRAKKLTLAAGQVMAMGLTGDRWTEGTAPAAVVISNRGYRPATWELSLGCDATDADLPLIVIIDHGQRKQRVPITRSGTHTVKLPPVQPYTRRLFILTTDKTWTPGPGDPRRLGVRLLNARRLGE